MGHVSEMSVYQMVFSGALFFGILFSSCRWKTWGIYSVSALFLCMTFVSGHKLLVMYDFSNDVGQFLEAHKEDFRNTPKEVLVYYIEDAPKEYSVYKQPVGYGTWFGYAFRSQWNWLNPEHFRIEHVKNTDEIKWEPESHPEYDTAFILTSSGSLTVLRN